ncbi:MAG: flagellar basal body rod protein FlgC [Geobacteraceae bacterium]|jgi:flagellar basal-body rod protein FlgC
MDFFTSMDVSSSGMAAERTRMNLISSNIANANSTRTQEGGPYRRKDPVFSAVPATGGFNSVMDRNGATGLKKVEVTQIREDQSSPRMQYDPTHPDADGQGYVALPNVNVIEEMVDMISATRSYEANVTAAEAAKSMAMKTLDLLK